MFIKVQFLAKNYTFVPVCLAIEVGNTFYSTFPNFCSSRQQYPMAQGLGWEDTHYRWPSPSLPPTLKKQQDHHNKKSSKFGTLDRLSPEKTLGSQGGKINYGFDSPTLERDDIRFSSTSSTNSEELVDDFGDPIKPNSKSSKGSKQSFSRTITRQSTDSEDEDDDGWTTEF